MTFAGQVAYVCPMLGNAEVAHAIKKQIHSDGGRVVSEEESGMTTQQCIAACDVVVILIEARTVQCLPAIQEAAKLGKPVVGYWPEGSPDLSKGPVIVHPEQLH